MITPSLFFGTMGKCEMEVVLNHLHNHGFRFEAGSAIYRADLTGDENGHLLEGIGELVHWGWLKPDGLPTIYIVTPWLAEKVQRILFVAALEAA